jgi:hypothetical protein
MKTQRRLKPRRGPPGIPEQEWRNPAYLAFLRREGLCIACLKTGKRRAGLGSCDPAHGSVNGMGSKGPDKEAVPLCRIHHDQMHRINWPLFQNFYEFNRYDVAAYWWERFKSWQETST